jgi:hypothetical protein
LNTVPNSINNKFRHDYLDEVVMVLNAHPIRQSPDTHIPGHMYSIPGQSGTKFLVHHIWAIWFIERRWVGDSDMTGTLVADEMGLGKTLTSKAAAMIWKLLIEKLVIGLPQWILWGNTPKEWVNGHTTTFPGLLVKNGSGIHCRILTQFPAILQRSSNLHHRGLQRFNQPLNQSWWRKILELQGR